MEIAYEQCDDFEEYKEWNGEMSAYDDIAQVVNAEKYGKKIVMCIDCIHHKDGICTKNGYKTENTESCIWGRV